MSHFLNLVPFVGATCARNAPADSCLGEFHLSVQRLHPRAQRQPGKLWRDALLVLPVSCLGRFHLCMERQSVTEGTAGGLAHSLMAFDII